MIIASDLSTQLLGHYLGFAVNRRSSATLEAMEFEWAPAKAAANLRKHKVSFDEAVTVFADFFSITASDPDHSDEELRYITVGRFEPGPLDYDRPRGASR